VRHDTIINPKTGRQVKVRVWDIQTRELLNWLQRTNPANPERAVSMRLLSQRRAVRDMEAEFDGEDSRSNFVMHIFENALDWRLGIEVLGYIRRMYAASGKKKLPKPFKVAVDRSGNVYIITYSGRIILRDDDGQTYIRHPGQVG